MSCQGSSHDAVDVILLAEKSVGRSSMEKLMTA